MAPSSTCGFVPGGKWSTTGAQRGPPDLPEGLTTGFLEKVSTPNPEGVWVRKIGLGLWQDRGTSGRGEELGEVKEISKSTVQAKGKHGPVHFNQI